MSALRACNGHFRFHDQQSVQVFKPDPYYRWFKESSATEDINTIFS